MTWEELRDWRIAKGLSQLAAADFLGRTLEQYVAYEDGARMVPDALASFIHGNRLNSPTDEELEEVEAVILEIPQPEELKERPPLAPAGDRRRFITPPGVVAIAEKDWVWKNDGDIPKGMWRKILTQHMQTNGGVVTAIEYHSNGVGQASMILIGRADVYAATLPGMLGGSYHPFRYDPGKRTPLAKEGK